MAGTRVPKRLKAYDNPRDTGVSGDVTETIIDGKPTIEITGNVLQTDWKFQENPGITVLKANTAATTVQAKMFASDPWMFVNSLVAANDAVFIPGIFPYVRIFKGASVSNPYPIYIAG